MAIAIRSETTGGTTTNASNGTFVVNKPSSVADGDYLIVIAGKQDDPNVGVLAGWTIGAQGGSATGNDKWGGIYYKKVSNAAGEPATYTFVSSGTSEPVGWWIGSLSGIDQTTPQDVAFSGAGNWAALSNDTSPNAPAVTTVTNGAMAFACWAVNSSSGTMPGGSWNTRAVNVGGNNVLFVASQIFASSGTSTLTPEITNIASGMESMVGMFVFRPMANLTATFSKTLGTATLSGSGKLTDEADLSKTLDLATLSSSGIVTPLVSNITATLDKTLDDVVANSNAKADILSNLSKTLSKITFSSSGVESIFVNSSNILEDIVFSSSGTVEDADTGRAIVTWLVFEVPLALTSEGTLDVTLSDATSSSSGKVSQNSALSQSLGNVAASSNAKASIDADLSKTLSNITNTASGLGAVGGSSDEVLDDDTFDAEVDVAINSNLAKTLANVSDASNGKVATNANLSKTLADATLSSEGTVGTVTAIATLIKTLDNIQNISNGTVAIGGDEDQTLDNDTFDAEVDVAINSNLSKILANATLVSEGTVGALVSTATLDVTLESITNVSSATNAIGGDEDTTLDGDTFDAEADVSISGNSSTSLADILFSSSGVVGAQTIGTLDVTLDGATSSGAGTVAVDGDLSVILAAVTLVATGIVTPLPVPPSTYTPKWKYDVPYYDRSFEVSEYNRKHVAQKDLTWKLKDTEG